MCSKSFGGKPPRDGQNCGGVDFVEKKLHGAEKKPPRLERTARGGKRIVEICFGESRQEMNKILVVRILCGGNGTVQKGSLQGC
ncbi:hypothetical protein T11_8582 [Trichinella zimbabwensis]|uniref:Uncharacterized protein n=1 Tax=Trichinella zimbabwensis TaxID=268475 RepID=A0A0V1GGV1_9BILA|nr:hypothetical protein T11_8582 [Trichinella zimbabwensis]